MESYRTLDLEAAFLTPVGYGNFRVFFQVLQRLIEKLVRNKKRFVIQKLKRPNRDNVRGTLFKKLLPGIRSWSLSAIP